MKKQELETIKSLSGTSSAEQWTHAVAALITEVEQLHDRLDREPVRCVWVNLAFNCERPSDAARLLYDITQAVASINVPCVVRDISIDFYAGNAAIYIQLQ